MSQINNKDHLSSAEAETWSQRQKDLTNMRLITHRLSNKVTNRLIDTRLKRPAWWCLKLSVGELNRYIPP